MGIYAHPDDEAFSLAGSLYLASQQGVKTVVVLATRGEAGGIMSPELDTPANRARLGELREAEAHCAARAIGLHELVLFGYPDGGVTGEAGQLVRDIVIRLRTHRPEVVVTFGPEGIYGHPDHLAVHRAVLEAYELAADERYAPDAPAPLHAVARLYYSVVPASLATSLNERFGPVSLAGEQHAFEGYPDQAITRAVDVSAAIDVKLAAIRCHHSQTAGMDYQRDDEMWRHMQTESLVLARRRSDATRGEDGLLGL
jgi:LmbE family N-acetylglucosaminyl deacetylase